VLCDKHNVDYSKILDVYEAENVKEISYLKYMGGFAGMCLPKDTKALAKLAKSTEVETFNFLLEENKKYI
jgi:UDP-glucose 6-dehydrogenase